MANTKDLIDTTYVTLEASVTKKEIEAVVVAFLDAAADALNSGEEVTLRNFGRFFNHVRAERAGRNPKTGDTIQIPAKSVVKFKGREKLASVNV